MRSQTPPGGTITLIGSISAHRVNFPQPQAAYNVSKAGIVALVKSLAAEWAVDGVRVNSISPGYQDTILNAGEGKIREARAVWNERNPMGRMGAVGEMDGMCVLLCSRAGSYMTGSDYVIDGECLFSFFIFSFLLLGCFFPSSVSLVHLHPWTFPILIDLGNYYRWRYSLLKFCRAPYLRINSATAHPAPNPSAPNFRARLNFSAMISVLG